MYMDLKKYRAVLILNCAPDVEYSVKFGLSVKEIDHDRVLG